MKNIWTGMAVNNWSIRIGSLFSDPRMPFSTVFALTVK